jgi:hypothetical protein
MRREKRSHVVIKEGQACGSQPLRIGGQVELPTHKTSLQLGCPIPPVAKPFQNGPEIRQEKDVHAGIGE